MQVKLDMFSLKDVLRYGNAFFSELQGKLKKVCEKES